MEDHTPVGMTHIAMQLNLYCNAVEPVTKDHLSSETIFIIMANGVIFQDMFCSKYELEVASKNRGIIYFYKTFCCRSLVNRVADWLLLGMVDLYMYVCLKTPFRHGGLFLWFLFASMEGFT